MRSIACADPVENAADKVSALAWRVSSRVRGGQDKQPDLVRHLHDLALLSDRAIDSPHFNELVKTAVRRDDSRSVAVKGFSVQEKLLKAIGIMETDPEYSQEYDKFVRAMSYFDNKAVPSYDMAIQKMKLLASHVVGQGREGY